MAEPTIWAPNGEKALSEEGLNRSVVARPTANVGTPASLAGVQTDINLLFFAANAADEVTAWGTAPKTRDKQLRDFITTESLFASALGIVSARNAAFSWRIVGPEQTAEQMQEMLESSNGGAGWQDFIAKISEDLYTQDSGAFFEIVREGDGPDSLPLTLNHLDAARCFHTGDPRAPVLYQDQKAAFHLLDWWSVVAIPEMPVAIEGMYGMQYCALTRMLIAAQVLRNVAIYKREKTGGRHNKAIHIVQGISSRQIQDAIEKMGIMADQAGLTKYVQPIITAPTDPSNPIDIKTMDLVSLPDGWDEQETFKQYVAQIAMAFLSDYQEFAPLPGGNLGSSAQSEVLHRKTRGKGPGLFKKLITHAMNWKVLPQNAQFLFEEMDLEAEEEIAKNQNLRAEARSVRILSGELLPEEARQLAVDAGDLPQELFNKNVQAVAAAIAITDEGTATQQNVNGADVQVEDESTGLKATGIPELDTYYEVDAKASEDRAGPFEPERLRDEALFEAAVQRGLAAIQRNVNRRIRAEGQESNPLSGLGIRQKALTDIPDDPIFWANQKGEMLKTVGPVSRDIIEEGFDQASRLGLATNFTDFESRVLQTTANFNNAWWSQLEANTRETMRSAIQVHVARPGATLGQLQKELAPVFGEARAKVIATTEVTRMYAKGNLEAYKGAPGVDGVEWRTVVDAQVDPDCEALNGERWPVDGVPQEPPLHPRCRCWLAPIVDDAAIQQVQPEPRSPTPDQNHITSEKPIGKSTGGIHAGDTKIGNLPSNVMPRHTAFSDTRVVHKRVAGEVSNEVNAFRTFEMIEPGWAPTVYVDTDGAGHMMRWIDDAGHGGTARVTGNFRQLSVAEARDYGRMSVTDAIMGNTDRHGANAMLFEGRMYPIDNGYARGQANAQIFEHGSWYIRRVERTEKFNLSLNSPQAQEAFFDAARETVEVFRRNMDELIEIWGRGEYETILNDIIAMIERPGPA